jgi:hypothetical protein
MNAAYWDQSIKVTVHFASRGDGAIMVWSSPGADRRSPQAESRAPARLLFRYGSVKTCSAARRTSGAVAAGICGDRGGCGGRHGMGASGAPKPARDRRAMLRAPGRCFLWHPRPATAEVLLRHLSGSVIRGCDRQILTLNDAVP